MSNPEHNHIVPLIGGPFCGQSISLEGVSLPHSLPMFLEGKFYMYALKIEEREAWTSVYYEYTNCIQDVFVSLKKDEQSDTN